jgi:hypothetical protein
MAVLKGRLGRAESPMAIRRNGGRPNDWLDEVVEMLLDALHA